MNIDPTDDCTFWFTSEYMGASGAFNWHTRIGTFKLPSCPINQPPTVSITSPTSGSTVTGTITVSANASDPDGPIASVKFDLPDGTSVTDTAAPFSTTFDTTNVANGSYTIQATATDNQSATAVATVTVTVHNCLDSTFSAKDTPSPIHDNDPLGLTSSIAVTGNGNVGSLSLSLDIAHPFRSDLMVTLISPAGTQFSVSSRQGDSQDNLVIVDQAITAFDGEALAGLWQLTVRDLAKGDAGTLNSWSLKLRDSCSPTAQRAGR
ncbi:MAG TPA: proprotein convertase P-domain-containing protein, partial [Kofleriaceae bacterium]